MVMKKAAKAWDEKTIKTLIERYACPVPFHEMRTRFLGNIATPALTTSPLQMIQELWGDDNQNSVFVYARRAPGEPAMVVALNMTPDPRFGYEVKMPHGGIWREVLNSDASVYGGANIGNGGSVHATEDGRAEMVIPPLGAIILRAEE